MVNNDEYTVLQEVTIIGKLSKTPKKIIGTMIPVSALSGSIRPKAVRLVAVVRHGC